MLKFVVPSVWAVCAAVHVDLKLSPEINSDYSLPSVNLTSAALHIHQALVDRVSAVLRQHESASSNLTTAKWWYDGGSDYAAWAQNQAEHPALWFTAWHNICTQKVGDDYSKDVQETLDTFCDWLWFNGKGGINDGFELSIVVPVKADASWDLSGTVICAGPSYYQHLTQAHNMIGDFQKQGLKGRNPNGAQGWSSFGRGTVPQKNTLHMAWDARAMIDPTLGDGFYAVAVAPPSIRARFATTPGTLPADIEHLLSWDGLKEVFAATFKGWAPYGWLGKYSNPDRDTWNGALTMFPWMVFPWESDSHAYPPNDNTKLTLQRTIRAIGNMQICFDPKNPLGL